MGRAELAERLLARARVSEARRAGRGSTAAIGLLPATATNIIGMVGVGPFLVIPFMITSMNGPHILYAWIAGALLALCDGLVYAHLGAALPGSGGPYLYCARPTSRSASAS